MIILEANFLNIYFPNWLFFRQILNKPKAASSNTDGFRRNSRRLDSHDISCIIDRPDVRPYASHQAASSTSILILAKPFARLFYNFRN
jgi:hypothetical protein